jgi:hypothetical protein
MAESVSFLLIKGVRQLQESQINLHPDLTSLSTIPMQEAFRCTALEQKIMQRFLNLLPSTRLAR